MATLEEVLATKEAVKFSSAKLSAELTIKTLIGSIGNLSEESPPPRQFRRLEAKFLAELKLFETASKNLKDFVLKSNPALGADEQFVSELRRVEEFINSQMIVIDKYNDIIKEKALEPVIAVQPVVPQVVLEDLCKKLADGQLAIGESLVQHGKNTNAPRPVQPFFTPKGVAADYQDFRYFLSKFEFFVRNVQSPKEKLQWLQSSCRGQAYNCIKAFSLEDQNYDLAMASLKTDYLDLQRVKQALLSKIVNYSFDRSDRTLRKVVSELRILKNDLEELKSVFGVDTTVGSGEPLLQVIIFNRLPGPLKTEIMQLTNTTFPSLSQIFEYSLEAVDKINARRDSPPPSKPKKENGKVVAIDQVSESPASQVGTKRKTRRRVTKPKVNKDPPNLESSKNPVVKDAIVDLSKAPPPKKKILLAIFVLVSILLGCAPNS